MSGIDDGTWSPSRDPHIARKYDVSTIWEKKRNKEALQHELKLPLRADLPLFGVVSRITEHKGLELLVGTMPKVLADGAQLVVHGRGDPALHEALEKVERAHADRVRVIIGHDERLAHRIFAGSDLLLVPSRFEPGGRAQIYAQEYGVPPIVHATGGLADTVVDFDGASRSGTGFTFSTYTADTFEAAVRRAIVVYKSDEAFAALRCRATRQDFSWRTPAETYERLYRA